MHFNLWKYFHFTFIYKHKVQTSNRELDAGFQ